MIKNLGIKILIAIVFGILIQTVLDFNPCLIIAIGLMSFMLSIWERRFLFGVVAALSAINVYLNAPVQLPHEGRDLVFSGIVVGEDHHENYTKLSINIDEALLKKDTINYKINVHFYTRNQETFLGRRLFIKGRIRPAKFLHQPNILSGKIIKTGSAGNLFDRISYAVRKYIDDFLKISFDDESYKIASGLILGGSSRLGKDLKDVFSRAGVLHILAVSGLHVGFVCLFVSSIILFIPLSHKIKFIIVMLVLLIYAGVTGFRPSICRATLMAFLFGLAIILQRNVDGIHIVNIVAIVFLIINPLLILDVGAQLSFAAIYGIIFLYPMIEKRLIRRVKNRYLRLALTAMAISFSAQAFVSPLLIYYFHRLPTLAVFSNLIIVPLASITIFLLFLSLMFSIFLIPLAKIIIFPISLLLNFLVSVSRFFADLSFSSVSLIISPVFLLVVYFLYPNKTRKLAIYLLLMAALVFSLSTFSNSVVIRISKDGTFITMPGGETVFVTSKNKTNLLFMYGLDKVDYLIAPKRFYPVKKDFFVLPEDLHFKEIKIGEMNIDLRKNLMLKYRDFIKNLSDDNFEKEGLIYMITDGKHVSQFETNLYKSIIDQITVDIRILYFKLKLML